MGPSVAEDELITTREAVVQACLQGVVLGGPERAQEARGSRAAEFAIQDLSGGTRSDRRPVRIELVQLIRCPRGHIAGRTDPISKPLFSREVPGLNIPSDEVVVVDGDNA